MKNRIRLFFRLLKKEQTQLDDLNVLEDMKNQINQLKATKRDLTVLMCPASKVYNYSHSLVGVTILESTVKTISTLSEKEHNEILDKAVNKGKIAVLSVDEAIHQMTVHYNETQKMFSI